MTVFSLQCLLKALGAAKAIKLGIGGFKLIGQLMEHADSLDIAAESAENLDVLQSGILSWLGSATTAELYPTDFGVAVAWNGFHLLNFGDHDNSRWYTEDQLEALENGQDVDGYENSAPVWKDRWNLG